MAKKKGGGLTKSGPAKGAFTLIWLIVVAGGILGLGRANDINSVGDLWDYADSWSQKADECYGDATKIGCDTGSGPGTDPSDGAPPEGYSDLTDEEVKGLTASLASLKVAPLAEVDYEREEWRHWSDLDKNGCDSREDVLLTQGKNVVKEAGDDCRAESGLWVSPYEGKKITDPGTIDIDHVIPLGYAATHGGQDWPEAKKEQFANDFSHLLATSASENRSKSDKGPGEYMPDRVEYWCTYSQIWIKTVKKYELWIEEADRAKLEEGLSTC